jgi:hypothetical protein
VRHEFVTFSHFLQQNRPFLKGRVLSRSATAVLAVTPSMAVRGQRATMEKVAKYMTVPS